MTKAAVTFTEIFIVLALIFIVQTVVNFNLFEGVTEGLVEEDIPDLVTLTITGERLLYFSFQKRVVDEDSPYEQTLWLVPSGSRSPSINYLSDSQYIIDRTGRCVDHRFFDVGAVRYGSEHGELESFGRILESQFGITVNITYLGIEESRWPIRALFSWSPTDLAESAEFRLGLWERWRFNFDGDGGWYNWPQPDRIPEPAVARKISYFRNQIVAEDPRRFRFDPERFMVLLLDQPLPPAPPPGDPYWGLVIRDRNENWYYDLLGKEALLKAVPGSDYVGFAFNTRNGRVFSSLEKEEIIEKCSFGTITPLREFLVSLNGEG